MPQKVLTPQSLDIQSHERAPSPLPTQILRARSSAGSIWHSKKSLPGKVSPSSGNVGPGLHPESPASRDTPIYLQANERGRGICSGADSAQTRKTTKIRVPRSRVLPLREELVALTPPPSWPLSRPRHKDRQQSLQLLCSLLRAPSAAIFPALLSSG